MQEVIQRLRESKAEHEAEVRQAGKLAGQSWARDAASYEELRNLERHRDANEADWDSAFDADETSAYGSEEYFIFVIRPDDDGNRDVARDTWGEILGDDWGHIVTQEGFVAAFADGALEVWDEVKDKV